MNLSVNTLNDTLEIRTSKLVVRVGENARVDIYDKNDMYEAVRKCLGI